MIGLKAHRGRPTPRPRPCTRRPGVVIEGRSGTIPMVLTRSQRETLKLLAEAGEGSTVPALLRRGCTPKDLHRLVRGGLVRAERIRVQGKPPSPADFHLRISDAGRKALARHDALVGDSTRLVLIVIMLFVLGLLAGIVAGALIKP
jgi:hypothetical protein